MIDDEMTMLFGATPDEEHGFIVEARKSSATKAWEAGLRLLKTQATFEWQKLTIPEAPFADWTDYLRRGVQTGVSTAYKWMDASRLPRSCTEELGIEKTAWLVRITDLTAVDETAEQALALELPLKDGGTRPVREMSCEQVEQAYRLIRDEGRAAKRPGAAAQSQEAATALQQAVSAAVGSWLKPGQVRARAKGEALLIDVRGVPTTEAAKVFGALARMLG